MQVSADPFDNKVSPDYLWELRHIDVRASEAMRVAFRDKALLALNKTPPAIFDNLRTMLVFK